MKQFILEWCINMSIALVIVRYIGIFFLGCYLLVLDNSTLKGGSIHNSMGNVLCSNYNNVLYKIL